MCKCLSLFINSIISYRSGIKTEKILEKEESEKIAIIKKEGYEILKKPKFDVGDKVRLIKYPNEIAIVKEIIWHEKNRRIFYILDVEGNKKRSNSWYYEDENKFEKINE